MPKAIKKPKPKGDDFKAVAKRLECDESKERFEAKLGKIAKATTPASEKRAPRKL